MYPTLSSRPIRPYEYVLITGCSSGIGLATAELLQRHGYHVIATYRKTDDQQRLAAYGFAGLVQLDLADQNSVNQAWQQALEIASGQIYCLFNNAGFGIPGALEDISRAALEEQFHTNVFGTHQLSQLAIKQMLKQGYGRILHNSSVLGFTPMSLRGCYNASKFALEGLAATQRIELASKPIDIALLQPGPIVSQFRHNAHQNFIRWVADQPSRHEQTYQNMIARLTANTAPAPFTLPAEAVAKVALKALRAKRPKAQYAITLPTHLFHILRRLLPVRWLDRLLIKVSGEGKR
ncbi:SDR family NAD(P)-dependent oxidoreductase [Thiomicrospira sp. ALE5]|uniref:SDR family NAD(P)-dependent oxidoreductase n=1 Tax=Thiomicrospira sp. ALE5 TaxID=748650 RepID=UPI0008F16C90|nr:SDR family NAD(P)-dependent oxidoreductase [Thiomicrospira sp. ALE5]SFR51192.1 Short-chain dehydrogenase [Thiomicrospira sp. ALE5]